MAKVSAPLLYWTLVVYAFLLPLEIIELGPATRGSLTLPKMAAVALLGLALASRKLAFRKFEWPHGAFACYLIALFFGVANVSPRMEGQVFSLLITLVQLFLIFWLSSNLLRDEQLARRTIIAFSLGCSVVAICGFFNIGGMATMSEAKGVSRLSFGDYDPNEIAYFMALGVAILIGMTLENTQKSILLKGAFIGLAFPQVLMIMNSGSRTGLASVVMGIAIFVILLKKRKNKVLTILAGCMVLCVVVYLALTNPATATRLQDSVEEGHVLGRGLIYQSALDMIAEKPFLGWGPIENQYELGRRTGRGIVSPHNLYLRVLLQVGFIGGGLFLIGLALCVWSAWRGRARALGIIPFVLIAVVLISNLALDYLTRKVTWFVLALVVAAPYMGGQHLFASGHGTPVNGGHQGKWASARKRKKTKAMLRTSNGQK